MTLPPCPERGSSQVPARTRARLYRRRLRRSALPSKARDRELGSGLGTAATAKIFGASSVGGLGGAPALGVDVELGVAEGAPAAGVPEALALGEAVTLTVAEAVVEAVAVSVAVAVNVVVAVALAKGVPLSVDVAVV